MTCITRPITVLKQSNAFTALRRDSKAKKGIALMTEIITFMSEIIEKGYARKVKFEELPRQKGKFWCLPHHGVYHPKKQGAYE